jgi:hypothetical protein
MRFLEWIVWLPARFVGYLAKLIFETAIKIVAAAATLLGLTMLAFWFMGNA